MSEIDYDRIARIADKAANKAQHSLITKIVQEVLGSYGLHSAEDGQELLSFVRREMKDKKDLRKGFFGQVGGHLATAMITLLMVWAASIKGIIN